MTAAAAADELQALYPALRGSTRVSKVGEGRELHLYRVGPGESCVLTSSCPSAAATIPRRAADSALGDLGY